jgi:hypothetical protein
MKQSVSLITHISYVVLAFGLLLFASCSKKDHDTSLASASFAGSYMVIDDDETYTLKIENTGGNNFQIREFGGLLNVPLKANGNGNSLHIPSQTFTNPSGKSITIVGTGTLSTKDSKDDTITFEYSLTGYGAHNGSFTGKRK